MQAQIGRIVNSQIFQWLVLAFILLAAITVGLETSQTLSEKYARTFKIVHGIIKYAFAVEAILKMAQYGRNFLRYFKDPWNVFDFLIVVFCFLPEGTFGDGAAFVSIFRMARVVRSLRLVTALPKLQLIVNCLLKSIPAMFYVGILLGLTFYVYAVIGVILFRDNDPVHFRNLPTSLLTLFRVVTCEDWTDVMYIQMNGSDKYQTYDNPFEYPVVNTDPQPYIGWIFFVSFVLFGTMIILNLFIGVIINSMTEAQEQSERNQIDAEKASNSQLSMGSEFLLIENQINELQQSLHRLRLRSETDQAAADT